MGMWCLLHADDITRKDDESLKKNSAYGEVGLTKFFKIHTDDEDTSRRRMKRSSSPRRRVEDRNADAKRKSLSKFLAKWKRVHDDAMILRMRQPFTPPEGCGLAVVASTASSSTSPFTPIQGSGPGLAPVTPTLPSSQPFTPRSHAANHAVEAPAFMCCCCSSRISAQGTVQCTIEGCNCRICNRCHIVAGKVKCDCHFEVPRRRRMRSSSSTSIPRRRRRRVEEPSITQRDKEKFKKWCAAIDTKTYEKNKKGSVAN